MKQNHYARKKRQFQRLSEQIDRLRQNGKWDSLNTSVRSRLTRKVKELYKAIYGYFSRSEWKRAMATVGFVLFGVTAVQAQNFLPPVQNPFGLILGTNDEEVIPTLVDLDQDGDLDVFGYDYSYARPVFYENTGSASSPAFGTRQVNPFGLSGTYSAWRAVADLDNDGDMDVLGTLGYIDYYGIETLFYYHENIGTANAPAYAPAQIDPFGLDGSDVLLLGELADMDADGDFDYLGLGVDYSFLSLAFYYLENTGTASNPIFATPTANPFNLSASPLGYNSVSAVGDLDQDGDIDVLCTTISDTLSNQATFHYYENTGSPTSPVFAASQTNPFGLSPAILFAFPTIGDMDADGDMDLITLEYDQINSSASFYFYENTDSTSALVEQELRANIYPTLFVQEVHVEFGKTTSGQARVYDLTGRCLHNQAFSSTDQIRLDLAGLTAGSYLLELQTTSGSKTRQITRQ